MEEKDKISFLKDEYLLLQRFYEDYDGRALNVKGWSATIAISAIGTGFYQTKYLWLFAAGASLAFWMLETTWKSFQYLYRPCIEELENSFARNSFGGLAPFQIYNSWGAAHRARGFQLVKVFFTLIVLFPHALTLVVGLI
jgi:hypothetical protein